MSRGILLLATYAFLAWTGTSFLFLYFCIAGREKKPLSIPSASRSYTKIMHFVPKFSQLVSSIRIDLLV
jgi:hypothetical protein